ncbi:MAG: hypothetical protein ACH36H_11860 [Candidatus Nanopelagicales bacterium]
MPELISHRGDDIPEIADAVAAAERRIADAGPEYGSREQLLADLELWQQCDLGRWMLVHHGWNAHWTRYCIGYDRDDADVTNPVERFFLTETPAVAATRQRWAIMSRIAAELLPTGGMGMSVPCGLMDDLVLLPNASSATLVGLDLDAEAVEQAAESAAGHGLTDVVCAVGDAWEPQRAHVTFGDAATYTRAVEGGVDLLMSNGLNIYVEEDDQVVDLYRAFRGLVRPGGSLVVSALTTPAEWDLSGVPREVSRRSLGLSLINDVQWANYRPVDTTIAQLNAAGFEVRDVQYDQGRVFPAFVAT